MNRIIKAAAVATIAAIGIIGTASAASADANVNYSGQGASAAGIPNNQPTPANDAGTGQFANWDGTNDAYDEGEGYLVWLLSANGATSATITLPGQAPQAMTKFGSNFKYVSDFMPKADQDQVLASYTGTAKGKVVLTISHGSVVFDTNIPSGLNWDETTGKGTVGKDAVGEIDLSTAKLTEVQTLVTDKSWNANSGDDIDGDGLFTQHRYTTSATTYNVVAAPIKGDNTGEVVGWTIVRGTVDSRTPIVASGATYLFDLRLDPVTGVNEQQTATLTYDLRVNGTTVWTDFITG